MLGAAWPPGPHLLRVEEYVSKALQAGHADLRAGVLKSSSQYIQDSLLRYHLQQGWAVEELGPQRTAGSGLALSPGQPMSLLGSLEVCPGLRGRWLTSIPRVPGSTSIFNGQTLLRTAGDTEA